MPDDNRHVLHDTHRNCSTRTAFCSAFECPMYDGFEAIEY